MESLDIDIKLYDCLKHSTGTGACFLLYRDLARNEFYVVRAIGRIFSVTLPCIYIGSPRSIVALFLAFALGIPRDDRDFCASFLFYFTKLALVYGFSELFLKYVE